MFWIRIIWFSWNELGSALKTAPLLCPVLCLQLLKESELTTYKLTPNTASVPGNSLCSCKKLVQCVLPCCNKWGSKRVQCRVQVRKWSEGRLFWLLCVGTFIFIKFSLPVLITRHALLPCHPHDKEALSFSAVLSSRSIFYERLTLKQVEPLVLWVITLLSLKF